MPSQAQPIHVVTVDSDPAAAKELIAELTKAVKSSHNLFHVANSAGISGVKPILSSLVVEPQVLICSVALYEEEVEEIREIAQRILPKIHLIDIPSDVKSQVGGETVLKYLVDQITDSKLPTRA